MRTVKTLLDECVLLYGGQSALARRLGVHQPELSAMQRGARPISGAMVGLLCDLLELDGDEARRLLANAVVDAAPAEKRGVLRRAFFVCLATFATCGLASRTTHAVARSPMAAAHLIDAPDLTGATIGVDKTFVVDRSVYTLSIALLATLTGWLMAHVRRQFQVHQGVSLRGRRFAGT